MKKKIVDVSEPFDFENDIEPTSLLDNRVYGDELNSLFEKSYAKKIKDYRATLLLSDEYIFDEVQDLIEDEARSNFEYYITRYLKEKYAIFDEASFLKSLTKKQVAQIIEYSKETAIPAATLFLTIVTMLNEDNEKQKISFIKLQEQVQKDKFNRADRYTYKPNHPKLIFFKKIIDTYLNNSSLKERKACKQCFDGDSEIQKLFKYEFQTAYNSFRSWYSKEINKNKYPVISTYLSEINKRKAT